MDPSEQGPAPIVSCITDQCIHFIYSAETNLIASKLLAQIK